jgi:pimeloyl-ACP methyl ester carboxylesterase
MPVAKVNGQTLYYEIEGQGDWVIFVHGGGGTHMGWWRQVFTLRDRFKCLTYDSRGCGQSDGIEDATLGDGDLLALMDHLKIDKTILNGHSAGGTAVSKVTQAYPERVHGLVMTDTPFGLQTPVLSKWAAEMLDKFSKGFDIRQNSVATYFEKTDPFDYFWNRNLARLNAGVRPGAADYKARFGSSYEKMRDAAPVDYSKFPVPVLFTLGEFDNLTVPYLVRGTAKLVGGSRLVEIPRSGHGVPQEAHEVYNEVLIEFFDHVLARQRDPKAKLPPYSLIEYFDGLSGRHSA